MSSTLPLSSLRVAVAQIGVTLADIDANIVTHEAYISKARAQNVELLVFPELSLTGYQVGRLTPQLAMSLDDPRVQRLAAASQDIIVVCGLIEMAAAGEYYNSVLWLCNGQVLACHRKLNLPTYGALEEGKVFHAGKQLSLVELKKHWPSSALICADMWNPGLLFSTMLQRPNILIAPINSGEGVVSDEFSNPHNWQLNLAYTAMTYGVFVAMANRCDTELEVRFWGGSRILGPRGEVLAQAGENVQLITADIEVEAISQARFDLPTMRDAQPALIKKLLASF
ncbi:MAG: nitrilase-related carbon-nitrogen hydrolase [Oceanospirillaceae bacterium]